ncbi:MAG: hypothetical protein JO079_05695 [Frankiaceae bacterium]|nr:hypothetical protein [Frankiaceae bacterium]MBV9368563.1 hypothetical protein [Frankiales bacterium]
MRFTGKQITTMVVAGCAAIILVPTVAVATGGTLITITDPTHSTYRAHVSNVGRLLTTTNGTVGIAGTVGVGGTVNNRDLLPVSPFSGDGSATNNGNDEIVIAGPTTKAMALSSLVIYGTGTAPVIARLRAVEPSSPSSCTGSSTVKNETMQVLVPTNTSIAVPFATPLTVRPPAGHTYCLIAFVDVSSGGSDSTINVSYSGFLQ